MTISPSGNYFYIVTSYVFGNLGHKNTQSASLTPLVEDSSFSSKKHHDFSEETTSSCLQAEANSPCIIFNTSTESHLAPICCQSSSGLVLTPKASARAVAPSFSRRFLPATNIFKARGLPWALDFL